MRPGPKPKPPEEIRTCQINVRLLEAELLELQRWAAGSRRALSDRVREVALRAARRSSRLRGS